MGLPGAAPPLDLPCLTAVPCLRAGAARGISRQVSYQGAFLSWGFTTVPSINTATVISLPENDWPSITGEKSTR